MILANVLLIIIMCMVGETCDTLKNIAEDIADTSSNAESIKQMMENTRGL